MNTSGMGVQVISVYKKYGAVLFEDAVQLTLFPKTRPKNFRIVSQCGTIRGCGTNRVNTVSLGQDHIKS